MKTKFKIKSMSVLLALALTMTAFIANTVTVSATEGTESKIVLGDVNNDDKIDIGDVTDIQRYVAGLVDFTDSQKKAADIYEDGKFDINDVTELQRYLAGYEDVNENISKTWHEEAYTINKPIYIDAPFDICNQCGTALKDSEALEQHYLENEETCWSYFTTTVWVYYDTGEWLVKNEDEGNRELVLSDNTNSTGKHYMEALGRRSAKRARYKAQDVVRVMSFEDNYSYGTLYRTRCRECGEILVEDKLIVNSDEELYNRNEAIAEEHNKQHKAKGEEGGAFAAQIDVFLEIEKGHWGNQGD